MKNLSLILLVALLGYNCNGQTKKKHTQSSAPMMMNGVPMDSLGSIKHQTMLPCIAYSVFDDKGRLIYMKADVIQKQFFYHYLWHWSKTGWYLTMQDFPVQTMQSDGSASIENDITYWIHGKQIYPIEILTKPVIK